MTSNGGALLLRQADRRLGLTAAVVRRLGDPRQRGKLCHGVAELLRQRVFGIALGYEDLNDHADLRHDLGLQTATGRDRSLASAPTLCHSENRADRRWAWAVHEVLVETFIAAFETPPEEIVLDVDATDDAVHGHQEGRFFHGYYDRYCFLPLFGFCGDHLLAAYLRPADIDPAKHSLGILKLLVARGSHRGAGGFRLLPLAADALVRAPRRRLHPRPGPEPPPGGFGRARDGAGRGRLRRDRGRSSAASPSSPTALAAGTASAG